MVARAGLSSTVETLGHYTWRSKHRGEGLGGLRRDGTRHDVRQVKAVEGTGRNGVENA